MSDDTESSENPLRDLAPTEPQRRKLRIVSIDLLGKECSLEANNLHCHRNLTATLMASPKEERSFDA